MKNSVFFVIAVVIFGVNAAVASTMHDFNEELKYLAAREMILSKNLANIDTPNYKPKDLKRPGAAREGIQMSVTHPGHISVNDGGQYDVVPGDIVEIKPNGNAVTAEHELAKKNENNMKFARTAGVLSKVYDMTKAATKVGTN